MKTPEAQSSLLGNGSAAFGASVRASISDHLHARNVPDPMPVEFDRSETPSREELLGDPFDPTGGVLDVPQGPSLGIEVDEEAVERYRAE